MYQVKIHDEIRQYEVGTTYLEIAKEYQKEYSHDIVLVTVDGKLQELHKKVNRDCTLNFETTACDSGHKTYAEANERGGTDNIAVVLVKPEEGGMGSC